MSFLSYSGFRFGLHGMHEVSGGVSVVKDHDMTIA
jgi:hypothetical protein